MSVVVKCDNEKCAYKIDPKVEFVKWQFLGKVRVFCSAECFVDDRL